jgi:hypothetical protein
MQRTRLVGLAAALSLLLLAACGDEDDGADVPASVEDESAEDTVTAEADGEPDEDDGFDDDLACGEAALSEDGDHELVTAHEVVDGQLEAACYGEEDPVLVDAWTILADIVPEDDLADLGVFAGFDSNEEGDEVTVAFVNLLDDSDQLQMSVNLEESQADLDALTLTLVHEFGHVLTQTEDQLDLDADPEDCPTFYNGTGCFLEGSLMDEWVSTFWADGEADDVDPFDTSVAGGEERCALDSGFFGPYAASAPEEDFAEALSAYVLGVPAESEGQQERLDLLDEHPGIAEQQERAEAAGYGPLDADVFEACGSG